jgi:hypothetical protein
MSVAPSCASERSLRAKRSTGIAGRSARWKAGPPTGPSTCASYAAALADYPPLVEVVGGYVAQASYDYETEFLFGLDVILDRLEQLLGER